ncbi:MFS transporter [Brachybacterium sp. EE-P12]|uniref:MFS transporter n=1 Tax=Brachybacterium sp. EE-P12 TaxID=2306299 RepID=UPI001F154B96|nr:MFS transporter [Brachybacterium sp. EE-P12]
MSWTPSPSTPPKPWRVAVICGMASYIDAAAIVSSGTALVLYQHSIGLSEGQIGVLSAALTLSIALGAFTGGSLGDRFGRRSVFLCTMAMIVVGALLLILAPSFTPLLVGMVLVGIGTGADLPVSLASISEAAADHNRGKLIGFSQILWFTGIIGANVFGIIAGDLGRLGGQIMFAHVGLVALVVMIARLSVPESTTWSVARAERSAGATTVRARSASILDILRDRTLLIPFLAIAGFYTLTNIGANTGGQFGTYIGVNVVGLSVRTQSFLGIVMLGVGMLGALVFMRLVDTPWRMRAYAVGALLLAGSYLVPVALGFSAVPWIAQSFFNAIGGAFAFEAIMKVWSQESFPTLLRSTVQGYVIAIARVIAAAVALVTPTLMHTPGLAYTLIAAVVAIGLACGWAGFHRPRFDAFAVESSDDADSHPLSSSDADLPVLVSSSSSPYTT